MPNVATLTVHILASELPERSSCCENYVGRSARHVQQIHQHSGMSVPILQCCLRRLLASELPEHSVMRNILSTLPGGMARTSLHWNGHL